MDTRAAALELQKLYGRRNWWSCVGTSDDPHQIFLYVVSTNEVTRRLGAEGYSGIPVRVVLVGTIRN